MKTFATLLLIFTSGLFAGWAFCSGRPEHISAEEFRTAIQGINSAYSDRAIGIAFNRVYLEHQSVIGIMPMLGLGNAVKIIWCGIDEFSIEEQSSLKDGRIPWSSPFARK